jgi:hypothetical protein
VSENVITADQVRLGDTVELRCEFVDDLVVTYRGKVTSITPGLPGLDSFNPLGFRLGNQAGVRVADIVAIRLLGRYSKPQ